ncbi:MAG TPA: ubiquitin-like small modifier protein 1 [Vicinamibacteria bacterium]|nr:ubiquitin-like small modifier protein 1 [Vicinamibacteria bacterium]
MSIRVHIPGPLRPYCGDERAIDLEAATVRRALEELEKRHPALHRCICDETGAVRRHVNLFVNKSHVRDLSGLETPLSHGDEIAIIPAVSGG